MALNFIENIRDLLCGNTENNRVIVTTKWDGSPAIVCGVNPENGQFFVGTKSVFNKKTPKTCYTIADVEKHHKDSPGLIRKMTTVLNHLPKINVRGVLQGDLLFSCDDVRTQNIDGEDYVTFKRNTILYGVPADSDLAEAIRRAKLGIVFHTTYTGDTLHDMTASFNVDVADLQSSEDVWVGDVTAGSDPLKQDDVMNITQHLDAASEALGNIDSLRFEQLLSSKTLVGMIKMFTNHRIRKGKQYDQDYMRELVSFVDNKIDEENTRDKENKKAKYAALLKQIEHTLSEIIAFQYHINEAKLAIIEKLQQTGEIRTFIPTDTGIEPTKHEGFVAVHTLLNKAVKLVDRLDFSRKNMLRHRKSAK